MQIETVSEGSEPINEDFEPNDEHFESINEGVEDRSSDHDSDENYESENDENYAPESDECEDIVSENIMELELSDQQTSDLIHSRSNKKSESWIQKWMNLLL